MYIASPEESGCIVAHENVPDFYNWNYERMSLKLADKTAKCRVERHYNYLPPLPACSKIARANVQVRKTILVALVQLRAQEQAFNWLLVGWAMMRNCRGSIRCDTGTVATKRASERYHAACKWCLSIFTKIKLLVINSSILSSVVVLLLKYNFCLRYIFWCLSSKNSLGWDFVFFHYVFCRNLAKLFLQFLHYYCELRGCNLRLYEQSGKVVINK